MKFDDIETGKIYSCGDDGVYKVLAKGIDWLCVLAYSYNHKVATPCIWNLEDNSWEYWNEETDSWISDIFDELKYYKYDTLTSKENEN